MEAWRSPDDYRPVVIFNPNSTRASRVESEVCEALADDGWGRYEQLETKYHDAGENADQIAEELRPGDLLLACGGDGLAHSVANALRQRKDIKDDIRMMPLPTGNACDISLGLYGGDILKYGLVRTMKLGPDCQLDAIGVTVNDRERWAMGYASLGLTAAVAATYGDESYRSGRPDHDLGATLRDMSEAARAVAASRAFNYVEHSDDGSAINRSSHDILFANSRRIARFGRIALRASDGPVMHETPQRGFGRSALRSLSGLLSPRGLRAEPMAESRLVIAQADDVVWYQLDGEAGVLLDGDTVIVRPERQVLPVIGHPARR